MAVAFDTAFETGGTDQLSGFSTSGTVAANSNRLLIVPVMFGVSGTTPTAVAATWHSVAMTQIGSSVTVTGAVITYYGYLFGLINPDAGSFTAAATWAGGSQHAVCVGAISLFNADQVTGWSDQTSNTGNSGTTQPTVTVPNVTASDASVSLRIDDNGSSATISAGVSDFDERNLNGNYGGAHRLGNGTTAWTIGGSVAWGMNAARVIAAAGAAPPFVATPNANELRPFQYAISRGRM